MTHAVSIVDLHNHAEGSRNTSLRLEDYLQGARKTGLAVALTEHNRLAAIAAPPADVLLLPGIEVLNDYGDFLVFGAPETCLAHRDIFDLIDFVHQCGGVVIAAHPFSGYGVCRVLDEATAQRVIARVDAVEVFNGRASPAHCRQAWRLARRHHKPATGGSDAHHPSEMFQAGTRFRHPIASLDDLVQAIRQGACEPVWLGNQGWRP